MSSFFGDIMAQFRTAPVGGTPNPGVQNPQQLPNPGAPGNLPQQQPAMQGQNGQLASTEQIPESKQPSPMDEFVGLWNTPKPKEGEVQDAPIAFTVDPNKVMEAASKIDFTSGISAESMQKMQTGGAEGVQEMLKLINKASQQAFAQASMTATKVTESGLEQTYQRATRQLPSMVRKETIGQALREDNPLFSNPATAPVLQALETQFVQQYPSATPAQIKAYAQRYLSNFATEISNNSPEGRSKVKQASAFDQDWSGEPI